MAISEADRSKEKIMVAAMSWTEAKDKNRLSYVCALTKKLPCMNLIRLTMPQTSRIITNRAMLVPFRSAPKKAIITHICR